MESRRKRHCRHCGERIRRASTRCYRCHKVVLPWTYYGVFALLVAVAVLLVLRSLGVL
jgi:hypothetical protein